MDQKAYEGAKQTMLDFKCKKILPGVGMLNTLSPEKCGVVDSKSLEPKIALQTPEKLNELLHDGFKKEQVKLPEKYRTLALFFDHMNCSLKLLGLYRRLPTFENISTQIEVLAQRKISYRHLAQMKYIFPEALQIDKIVVHDSGTLCMKHDMKITLLCGVVDGHSEVSDFVALSQVFNSRLYNFFTTHPEASDVPEAILPEPFTKRSQITVPDELPVDSCVKSQLTSTETDIFSEKFNPGPHFSRHFSQTVAVAETEKTQVAGPVAIPPSNTVDKQVSKTEQQKEFVDRISVSNSVTSQDTKNEMHKNSPGKCFKSIHMNPHLESSYPQCSSGSIVGSPVFKLTSSDDSFKIETPLQLIPKRSISSCDLSHKIVAGQGCTSCCKPAKRALDFFHLEVDESALDSSADESKCDEFVYRNISQIPKGLYKDRNTLSPPPEVEEGLDCVSEVCNERQRGEHQHNPSCLVEKDMVALIRSIFKSVNGSPITREELVHKIIMNNFDIVDKREVEEQIDILERLVPDWIYRKLARSGDILYNIKDDSDLDSVRAKLISV